MTVKNYEAVAIVKTALRKKNILKVQTWKFLPNIKKACISAYQTYKEYVKQVKEDAEETWRNSKSISTVTETRKG